ncbi:Tail-anchored protein insertion receptor WRB [Hondaea fermentalgiana]|uniref:Tail-anchored protein insertion receptor WRB n=1 Tax=Hondaea fermentalgiana TaxID=2315210 RepID=A0A2R5GQZ6_9STRA|nr:Tail-anchored protein insertion receptor WRB [Hondaea fermentalgiana]|eukprot:GBG32178.1 Tail-anchored protein insertion receptor WRB [Hondaea fermentalgiana]
MDALLMEGAEVRHVLQAQAVLTVLVITVVAEAKEYNLPSTFMKWAKLKRQAAAKEREALKMAEARTLTAQASWRKRAAQILGLRQQVLWAALYFFYESSLPAAPLLEVESGWLWPLGRIFALPSYSAGSLSVLGWTFVCQKVASRVLESLVL